MFGPIFVELKCSDEKTKVFKNSSMPQPSMPCADSRE